jgi:hypothetical protein
LEELKVTTAVDKPDIILITETWCSDDIRDSELAIEGYNMENELRRDRTDTHNGLGGGLLVYSKSGLALRKNDRFDNNEFNQFCAFTIMTAEPMNVIVVYRPPNSGRNNLTQLCNIIENMEQNSLAIGDFNLPDINWETGTSGPNGRPLLEATQKMNLEQLVNFLCPAALHTIANISMRIFPISLSFLVSGILFF